MKLIIFTLFAFINVSAYSSDVIKANVSNEVVEKQFNLIKFNLESLVNESVFCRKIALPEVEYHDQGEYFDSLEAHIKNVSLIGKEKKLMFQKKTDELLDLYSFSNNFTLKYDASSLSIDCEKRKKRLNNIYVVDDKRSCGGDISVVNYKLDLPNNRIVKNETELKFPLTQDAKVIYNTYSKNMYKFERDILYLIEKDSTTNNYNQRPVLNLSLGKGKEVVGFYIVNEKDILFLIAQDNLLKVVRYTLSAHGTYNLKDTVSVKIFDYQFARNAPMEQIQRVFRNNFKDFMRSFIIYQKYNHILKQHQIYLAFRLPDAPSYYTLVNVSNGNWHTPKMFVRNVAGTEIKVFTKITIGLKEKMKFDNAYDLDYSTFRRAVETVLPETAFPYDKKYSFKNFSIEQFNGDAIYSFNGNKTTSKIKSCKVQQVFTDLFVPREGLDINGVYRGKTALIRAIQRRDYQKALSIVSSGASVNSKDVLRNTPAHYAVNLSNINFLKLLALNGADFNIKNRLGETALTKEIKYRFKRYEDSSDDVKENMLRIGRSFIKLLLANGAKVGVKDRSGKSALDYVKKYKLEDTLSSLFGKDDK